MHLLAGADADDLDRHAAVADERLRDVGHERGRHVRDVGLAGKGLLNRREDQVDGVVEAQQEPRHVRRRDRDRPTAPDLVVEQRDHRSPRCQHVPVAHADEPCVGHAHVRLDEHPLLDRLGHAHHVHRLARLVRGHRDDGLDRDAMVLDGTDDVLGSLDVGLDRLVREVLARGHLLHRGGVEDDVGITQGRADRIDVADVADPEGELSFEVREHDLVGGGHPVHEVQPHLVLLRLVAREHDDALRRPHLAGQQALHQQAPERTGAARHEQAFTFERSVRHAITLR